MWTTRLYPRDRAALERLLLQRGVENLVPLGVLALAGLTPDADTLWEGARAAREGGAWEGALLRMGHLGEGWAAAVPAGSSEACFALGERARGVAPRFMLAARPQADALWAGLGAPAARVWSDHRLYLCDRVSEGPRLRLRRARLGEARLMAGLAQEMEREDMGVDPLADAPDAHLADVTRKIAEGRVLVAEEEGQIVFKGDVGLVCGRGALIGGLWVAPAARGRGLGQAGVRALCADLLRRSPVVGLHVREDNAPAIGAYLRAGFRADAPFRLVVS